MGLLFVRGTLVDAVSVGDKGMIAYELEDNGHSVEVLTMSPIPGCRQGEFVEFPVRPSVRKRKDGALTEQVSYWFDGDQEKKKGVSLFGSAPVAQGAANQAQSAREPVGAGASANGTGK